MLVKDMMKRAVVSVGPEASLAHAARAMRDQHVGCLPVVEDGRLIGMITDRDIVVRGVAEALDPHRAGVRAAMSADAIACSGEDTVARAQALMTDKRVKHLPVVDRQARMVGLITLRDITGQFARCRPHQVTFYKRLASSSGHLHNVEIAKVYLSPAIRKEDAVPAALAKFEHDRGLQSWDRAADNYELLEGS